MSDGAGYASADVRPAKLAGKVDEMTMRVRKLGSVVDGVANRVYGASPKQEQPGGVGAGIGNGSGAIADPPLAERLGTLDGAIGSLEAVIARLNNGGL